MDFLKTINEVKTPKQQLKGLYVGEKGKPLKLLFSGTEENCNNKWEEIKSKHVGKVKKIYGATSGQALDDVISEYQLNTQEIAELIIAEYSTGPGDEPIHVNKIPVPDEIFKEIDQAIEQYKSEVAMNVEKGLADKTFKPRTIALLNSVKEYLKVLDTSNFTELNLFVYTYQPDCVHLIPPRTLNFINKGFDQKPFMTEV